MCHPRVQRTYRSQRHWTVPPPTCHLGPQPGGHPNTKHCLEIHVTLTEELGAVPHPLIPGWSPLVEDMLHDARTRLTEAVVTGPGRAVLFYGKCSMGEGLTADKARDVAFLLTGAGMWVGKLAYLIADPMTIQECRKAIAQAISDHHVKARGPGHPHVNPPAQQSFQFDPPKSSPLKDAFGDGGSDCPPSPHQPSRGWECNRHWRDQRPPPPGSPSPSPDCGFKSNWSSLLTDSLMSSRPDWSDRSRCSRQGRWQSWRWDLMVYQCAGCRDCTLLPYVIRSLQGYPAELVQSSGMDITLDDVLTILDEHYNNVKVLDVLNLELFQLWMAHKETVSDRGICLLRHLQILATSFPDCFPPDCVAELKRDHFYGRLPK